MMTYSIDDYLEVGCGRCKLTATPACKVVKWQKELKALRQLVLNTDLQETVKWGVPCYVLNGKNVVLIHAFKDYCGLLFMKGSLMTNAHGLLIQQTDQVQAGRQMRFTQLQQIQDHESDIMQSLFEAIELEKSGKKIEFKPVEAYAEPQEFTEYCQQDKAFAKAFKALTPGRQKGYLLYFAGAKQSKTRLDRIQKYHQAILSGKGLND
jgi:uncharacterized protein YdeI (YjbR/CyaY-like superfamily)